MDRACHRGADAVLSFPAHWDEIFHEYTMSGTEYPGDKAVREEATAVCRAEFTEFVGIPYEESRYDFWVITPTQLSWNKMDDRIVQCAAYDPRTTAVTGTLDGAGE